MTDWIDDCLYWAGCRVRSLLRWFDGEYARNFLRWLTGTCRDGALWVWHRVPERVRRFVTDTIGVRG